MKKLVLMIVPIIILISIYFLTIHISFENIENVVINVFENYEDELPKACLKDIFNNCIKKIEVTSLGTVDTNKIGTYEITYTAKNKQIKKIISVLDTEKPVITIKDEEIIACPNTSDINISYTVSDNYTQDLKVNKIIKDNNLILEAIDSSENKTTIIREINFLDNEKPKINLKGEKTIYLIKGEKYKEPGYEATDNCIKNMTEKVKVTNNININKVGKYEINYEVSDGFNKTVVNRIVYVYEKKPDISIGDKVIYLTFDDGPSVYTKELLNILKEYNVKATFFVTGNGNREYIKKAYNEGHSIGIHTYSHVYKNVYASEEAYFNDLEKVQKIIKEQTGEESRLVRFPGGSSNTVSRFNKGIMTRLSKELERRGYKYFDWNVSSSDTVKSNSDDIANTVIRRLKKGNNVVLQHDTKYYSVKAVRKIIEYGLANGYTFAKLDVTSPTVHHGINN
ncbi:MAG: polysaccharide deacetylase family protein [Candidatus Faecisoma sp.]|nr:polysaccharide deacetylase family protein [Acholeplasma sp.]MDY2892161.1 polysaccharide deacetylase family protein [Candidatus Faecisoma sp.]